MFSYLKYALPRKDKNTTLSFIITLNIGENLVLVKEGLQKTEIKVKRLSIGSKDQKYDKMH